MFDLLQALTSMAPFGQRVLTTAYKAELFFMPETMDRRRYEAFTVVYHEELKFYKNNSYNMEFSLK